MTLSSSSIALVRRQSIAVLFALLAVGAAANACTSSSSPAPALTTTALQSAVIIDVRTSSEHQAGHLNGDHNIPVDEVSAKVDEILALAGGKKDAKIVVYCASGRRSGRAKSMLEAAGFTNVENGGGFSGLKSTHPELVAAPAR